MGRNWCILDCNSLHKTVHWPCTSPVLPEQLPLMRPARQGHAIVYRWAWMITHEVFWPGSQVPPLLLCISFFLSLIVSLEHWQKCHTRTTHMATISDYNRNWLPIVTDAKRRPWLSSNTSPKATIVTCIHAMWESTDWKLYIVRIIGWQAVISSAIYKWQLRDPQAQVQSHVYLSTCTLIW